MSRDYDDLSREELVRLLQARDRRDATRLGLVWEANEIERDKSLNADFVALELDRSLCVGDGPWRNLLIEGDNFDALRFMRMAFAGRIRCILIDPPYNTGNRDFIYNDRFVGKDDSWRHSMWIEWLYRRLILARDLLTDDGVLLCCINDENRARLELLLDKVFPGRRIGSFVWRTKDSGNDAGGNFSQVHEHVLVYGNAGFAFAGRAIVPDDYRNPDGDPRGDWTPQPLTKAETFKTRPNTYYPIQNPETRYWYPCDPERVWAYASEAKFKEGVQLRSATMEELIRRKEIYFPPCRPDDVMLFRTRQELLDAIREGKGPMLPKKKTPLLRADLPDLDFWIGKPIAPGRPSRKDFLKNKEKTVAPVSSWVAGQKEELDYLYDELDEELELLRTPRGGEGTDALKAILGSKAFNHPKPPTLIRNLVRQTTRPGDIVLDFVAGSGTAAQAVLEVNKEDGGQRRFIMVSSTESSEAEPDKNICRDVCARRIGNVIHGYGNAPGAGGDFAYLRCRKIPDERLAELRHEDVWTALQLIHLDTVSVYRDEAVLTAGDEQFRLIYVPRVADADFGRLRQLITTTASARVYSWQAELLRQKAWAEHVEFETLPRGLMRRFGVGS
jgi:adenine-specific DNA-methyltransferase